MVEEPYHPTELAYHPTEKSAHYTERLFCYQCAPRAPKVRAMLVNL